MVALGGIVIIGIGLLSVAGLVLGIILWATSGKGGGDMACGSCGYGVRGLSQLTCPECGADLREAGINRTGSPGKRTTGIVLTSVCGAFVLLGCGLFSFALVGWQRTSTSYSVQATNQMQLTAQAATIAQNSDGSTTTTYSDGLSITTHPDGSETHIHPDGTTIHFDANGVETQTPGVSDSEAH